jgi:hypothetical protein
LKINRRFFAEIRALIAGARKTVVRGVDLIRGHTNFEIGRRIVEEEQRGKNRAAHGEQVVNELAERLTSEFGKQRNQALVEVTLPKGAKIHAREYPLCLPGKAELRQKLLERIETRAAH